LDLLPFHQNGGRADSFCSDHSTGDEGLETHTVNRRLREDRRYEEPKRILAASLFQLGVIENSNREKFCAVPGSAYTCLLQRGDRTESRPRLAGQEL
jgi:hypothetical protein